MQAESGGPGRRHGISGTDLLLVIAGLPFMVFLFIINFWPRWVPDLARFTRGAGFRQLHAAWADWLNRNFELIESEAPWLDRAGSRVSDYCQTHQASIGGGLDWGSIPRPPAMVRCKREVTAVYGFDGSLRDRLAGLSATIAAAGWEELSYATLLGELARREENGDSPGSPIVWVSWSFIGDFGLLPAPSHVGMSTRWISRGQSAGQLGLPDTPASANAVCRPAGIAGADICDLAAQALASHEHALAIGLTAHYYPNADTTDDHFRKRLIPVFRPLGH
jgi:hypothetical protein